MVRTPLLSIITVIYNAKDDFIDTKNSITSQTFRDFEWIIIDGGSTDGTVKLIEENQENIAYWVSEQDNGIFDAMNKGIAKAKGEWITFLNAGDTYFNQNSLSAIFDINHSHYQFIYGDMFLNDQNNNPVRLLKAEKLSKFSISKGMIACHQAMFVKRDISPLYSNKLKYQGDLKWVMDILFSISDRFICYRPVTVVNYKSGGFSDQRISKQCKTHIQLIYSYYGLLVLVWRIPRLIRRYGGKWARRLLGIETFRFWIKR